MHLLPELAAASRPAAAKVGFALVGELCTTSSSASAASTVAAALALPCIAYHAAPRAFTAKADALAVDDGPAALAHGIKVRSTDSPPMPPITTNRSGHGLIG
jgi:hypothetical protein